jgi:hypothetical protein
MNAVREKIKIKTFEKTQLVQEVFCEEQQVDIEEIVAMVEDLVATAVACGSSSHNYSELQRSKEEFVNNLIKRSEKYRVIA